MSAPSRIEYEAIGSRVYLEAHLGLVVLELATSQGSKVAVHMRRMTFDDLAERIAKAQLDANDRARGR
jgi:hypothetical protein